MNTRSLVYAYGCGTPTSGLREALVEAERCADMWDGLVLIDREVDAQMYQLVRCRVVAVRSSSTEATFLISCINSWRCQSDLEE